MYRGTGMASRHLPQDHIGILQAAEEEAHQAAQRQAEEHRAKVARTEQQRKQQTSLLRKRTNSGQPVMRHRIEKLLDAIQR